jgi:hypothetical protein
MEMKTVLAWGALVWAILSVSANAAAITTKGGYENDRDRLSDPSAFNATLEQCSHMGMPSQLQEKLVELMKVPQSKVRFEFCRRFMTAYVKGVLPYNDYVAFVRDQTVSDGIARALGVSKSTLENLRDHNKSEVALPIFAKMSTGETFRGSTIASKAKGGHFEVRSSRSSTTCSGNYDLSDRGAIMTYSFKCSDGRTGNAIVSRTPDLMSAKGKVTLSDGSKGSVVVGRSQKG